MRKQTLILAIIPILAVSFAVAFYAIGWTEPTQAPPSGNISLPLNTGNIGQSKTGGLILNTGGATNGLIIDKGNLCLGTDCRGAWPSAGEGGGVVCEWRDMIQTRTRPSGSGPAGSNCAYILNSTADDVKTVGPCRYNPDTGYPGTIHGTLESLEIDNPAYDPERVVICGHADSYNDSVTSNGQCGVALGGVAQYLYCTSSVAGSGGFGLRQSVATDNSDLVKDVVYQAQADGFLMVPQAGGTDVKVLVGNTNPPTNKLGQHTWSSSTTYGSITVPVAKNEYVLVTGGIAGTPDIWWQPIGIGGLKK